jgi:hypothetical protein
MADIRSIGAGTQPASGVQSPDLRHIATKLRGDINTFNEMLPPHPEQLGQFAKTIQNLDQSSRSALDNTKKPVSRLMEDLRDSADTVQTILSQPLDTPGASENASLISAATSYQEEDKKNSDLYKISVAFSQYPDQTDSLKKELALTSQDLEP